MAEGYASLLPNVLLDSLKSILYFPVWWYGRGFFGVIKKIGNSISYFNDALGFTIWIKNIFTPLFGQNDATSRIISFFLRLVNIIFRGLLLLLVVIFHVLLIFAWLILPPAVLWLIFL